MSILTPKPKPKSIPPSPKILDLAWGKMWIEGLGEGKDFKLWPGGGRDWDWNEYGTHHSPGILAQEAEELVANGAKHVVLSKGMLERLEITPELRTLLNQQGIVVHIAQTEKAAKIYNRLIALSGSCSIYLAR